MLTSSATRTPQSNYHIILDALANYLDQTGTDISTHPFADKLQHSNSPDAILELLQDREKTFKEYRDGNRNIINSLKPAVQVLYAFSGILGESLSLVPFSPAKAIFVGVDVLLAAATGVSSSYDALLDLFECIGNFLQRLTIYTRIPPSHEMTDIIVKIMDELLSVLALATKQIKQGRFKKFTKKLLGENEVESVLQRLDRLTQDEARMTVTQTLDVVHGLVNNMRIVMDDGRVSMDSIREALVMMHQTANELNKIKRDQIRKDVHSWLSPPDPSINHDFVSNARHSGSSAWFFNGSILKKWKETGSLLWIHGKPGSGKSTLLSAIIQDIQRMCEAGLASMAYFYLDFRDVEKQSRNGLLLSFLSQLCADSDSFCDILSRLRSSHVGGARKPTESALINCLKDMLSRPGCGSIYLIVDAIDECPNITGTPSAREKVLELVEELVDWHLPNVFLCLTSRPEIDIRSVLEPLTNLQISLHDEVGQRQDIISYINAVVLSDKKMRKWRKEDQQLVINTLSEKANGMFRWVVCQIDRLRRSFPASIRNILNELPKGLDETYEHALLGIDDQKRKYAQRLFQCLAVSIRPLRIEELADILAVHFDPIEPPVFNTDWRPTDAEEAILSACSSVINIADVDGSHVVQFTHCSVKEFLTSYRLSTKEERLSYYHIDPVVAHTVVTHTSLSLLLQFDDEIDRDTIRDLPLALYAARHWVEHARSGGVSLQLLNMMMRLFDSTRPHFAAWVWLYDIDHHWVEPMSGSRPTLPQALPLYYACLCGLPNLVAHLAAIHPSDVTARGGSYATPLHAASVKGYLEVARLLLSQDANPNSLDDEDRTPLDLASRGGYLNVMGLLLECGADVNSADKKGRTPLHLASTRGDLEVALFLLNHGANVNSCDYLGCTALHRAAYYDHTHVVRLLLDSGSNVKSRDHEGHSTLHLAASKGRLGVVQLVLEQGADVDAVDDDHRTALHISSKAGQLDIVRLLLENHADPNAQDRNYDTPWNLAKIHGNEEVAQFLLEHIAGLSPSNDDATSLHIASENGNLDAMRLFLERGEDVNAQNVTQRTPLILASSNGNFEASQFLLENGANVNSQDKNGWGALHVASRKGYPTIVQLLLDYGADVNAKTTYRRTPLDHASSKGAFDVVFLLIKHGANLDARDESGWTALHRASYTGQLEVVRLLLEHGADVSAEDDKKLTPLDVALNKRNIQIAEFLRSHGAPAKSLAVTDWTLVGASKRGRMDIVKSLLERGEDVNAPNLHGETPLAQASFSGHVEIAKLLLDRGADVSLRDNDGGSPLHYAAIFGHFDIANLLLEHGADINAPSEQRYTPLFFASRKGHLDVVRLLLQHGANAQLQNEEGETPLQIALARGHRDVAQLLSAAPRA